MVLSAVVAIVAISGLWALFRETSRGHGAGSVILSALPLALLFLIAPVPVAAYQSIKAFQAMAASGGSPDEAADKLAHGIADPLWPGSLGCVLVICAAAAMQARVQRRDSPPVQSLLQDEAAPPQPVSGARGNWLLVASAVLAVPVGVVHYLTRDIAPLIVEAARVLTAPGVSPESTIAGVAVSEFSEMIAKRLLVATVGGFALTFFVFMSGLFNIVAVRHTGPSDFLERLSWAVFAIVGVGAVWNLIDLTITLRSF